jgi:hypothetical protein
MISHFKELQSSHPLLLKHFLYQQFMKKAEYEKAEELANALNGCEVTAAADVYDTIESYRQHLLSFLPLGFDEYLNLFLSKSSSKLFSYRKKINEIKQQLKEMLNDFEKPFYGIDDV